MGVQLPGLPGIPDYTPGPWYFAMWDGTKNLDRHGKFQKEEDKYKDCKTRMKF